jgi:hypothetical protein
MINEAGLFELVGSWIADADSLSLNPCISAWAALLLAVARSPVWGHGDVYNNDFARHREVCSLTLVTVTVAVTV